RIVDVGPRQVEGKALAGLQIAARAEGLVTRGGQHDGAHLRIRMRLAKAGADARDHVRVDGIALVGPVDRDPERLAALLVQHGGGCFVHCSFSFSASISTTTRPLGTWSPTAACTALTVPASGAAWMCSIL